MLIIAGFAIYVIIKKQVTIMRGVSLEGARARQFGVMLLVLLLPVAILIRMLLESTLPPSVLANAAAHRGYRRLFGRGKRSTVASPP
jgi:hypothetical protein